MHGRTRLFFRLRPACRLKNRALNPGMAKMLGQCLGERDNARLFKRKTTLHGAVEAMRDMKAPDMGYALLNVVNCWREARDMRIIGEDLSRLDLTHVPMNGIRFSSAAGKTRFDGAVLSPNSLLPMGHSGAVKSAAYSPDGKNIVTAANDGSARICDSASGELIKTLEGHSDWVYSASYSPDGIYRYGVR